jgi:hypothetical protein
LVVDVVLVVLVVLVLLLVVLLLLVVDELVELVVGSLEDELVVSVLVEPVVEHWSATSPSRFSPALRSASLSSVPALAGRSFTIWTNASA